MLRCIFSRTRSRSVRRGQQPQACQNGQFRAVVEQLEDRTLLSNDVFVITHGFELDSTIPGWVVDMAHAINDRLPADERADTTTIDGKDSIDRSVFSPGETASGNRFLLLSWTSWVPGILGQQDRQAAEGALYDAVVGVLSAPDPDPVNLHFIGHSRGAVVNSEVIERLATSGFRSKIGFLQMTTLDPHPWSLALDPRAYAP